MADKNSAAEWLDVSGNEEALNKNERLRDNLCVSNNGRLKWLGSFEELKDIVSNPIMLTGKWAGPGGDCKLFEAENTEIRWYSKTKTLTVKGDKADEFKAKIMPEIIPNIDEQTEEIEKDGGNAFEQEGNQAKHGMGTSDVVTFAELFEKISDVQQQMHNKFEYLSSVMK
ncbi:Hypothetical predicted protein [Paramuricea clavata]|uniref:Uncharacterized protein n=1 Tax=Paramuricea clavata TaxID=317549 RepID=A0A7D9EQ63_PARCT|nr:Hypothetical predicted protein [Paramuricea clavata]